MRRNKPTLTRRDLLIGGVGGLATAVTGCLGNNPTDSDGDTGNHDAATSFFMPYDVTKTVARDRFTVEDLVPIGEHGHDYDPDPGIVQTIESADVFVYTRDFSSWQDDAARTLRDEGDIVVVEISDGIAFIDSPAEDNDEHFWMNPRVMADGVDNVVDGLSEVDPDGADDFRANGDDLQDELATLDEEFQEIADARRKDQIVIGSHDSFQWWWDEYGFDIYSPVGISPDDRASPAEIQRVEELIEEHDIEYVLYDLLEPTNLAESIAEETGTELLPLSPVEGQTEELINQGIDTYLNHQREINLETLKLALDVPE